MFIFEEKFTIQSIDCHYLCNVQFGVPVNCEKILQIANLSNKFRHTCKSDVHVYCCTYGW